ncbi:MAG: aspartate aminotransferase family protein [Verrucomicrobiota bacterium]|nr:aspartate aminotransferase family protein [Verrucomicrobiota bacterium]
MSKEVIPLFDQYVVPSYGRNPVVFIRGEGNYIWDDKGKRYLDFGGGIAVNSLGHCHPAIQRALVEQSAKLIHTSNLFYTEPQGLLAKKLVGLIGPGKVFFCNSGAEATELLFKFSRLFGHLKPGQNPREIQERIGAPDNEVRYEVIAATNSFHGRTLGGIAATGQDKIKKGFNPLVPGFVHVPYNDLNAVAAKIGPLTAAVLVEGIQGEIGVVPAQADYLVGLRKLCTEKNILLLFDAIQCGMWRTGKFMSYEKILEGYHKGREFLPDGIAMAKSLGGGFPIGAVWFREPYKDMISAGMHGTTFGGTPLACAVALAVLETIEKEGLVARVLEMGNYLKSALMEWTGKGIIKEVRGYGLMLGIELDREAKPFISRLFDEGLIVIPSGTNVIRLLPAYITKRDHVGEAVRIMKKVLVETATDQEV